MVSITGWRVLGWCVAAGLLVGACGDDGERDTTFGGVSNSGGTSGGTSAATTSGPSTGEPTTGATSDATTTAATSVGESSSGTTGAAPVCGDGNVDPGEACDLGADNSDQGMCKKDCSAQ